MKASLMALVGAATVLAASVTGASAQVLNLTGQFQCVQLCSAAPPALAYLTQVNWEISLVNDGGFASRAWIDYPGHIWVAGWNEGAFYSPDGMTIRFDNGTVWQRVIDVPVYAPPIRRHYRYTPLATNGLIISGGGRRRRFRSACKDLDCAFRHNPDVSPLRFAGSRVRRSGARATRHAAWRSIDG